MTSAVAAAQSLGREHGGRRLGTGGGGGGPRGIDPRLAAASAPQPPELASVRVVSVVPGGGAKNSDAKPVTATARRRCSRVKRFAPSRLAAAERRGSRENSRAAAEARNGLRRMRGRQLSHCVALGFTTNTGGWGW